MEEDALDSRPKPSTLLYMSLLQHPLGMTEFLNLSTLPTSSTPILHSIQIDPDPRQSDLRAACPPPSMHEVLPGSTSRQRRRFIGTPKGKPELIPKTA